MARTAVTGATGFVGRQVVARLLREGNEVRALARFSSDTSRLTDAVEVVRGDVRGPEAVRALLKDCRSVVHLAPGFSSDDDVADISTSGTRAVIEAARNAGVERLVLMSCLGADAAASSFYAAKWKAEMLVRASDIPFTILRPSLVLGQGDGVLQPLAGLVRTLPVIPVPGKGQHRQQPIDVEDLARCVLVAMTEERLKDETVSVGGSIFVTFRQLVDLVSGQLGVIKPKVLVPSRLVPILAHALPAGGRALFLRPRLDQFKHSVVASPGIVQRTFGFEPRPIVPRLADYLA